MASALVQLSGVTGTVTNVIVADADTDFPPEKTSILVNIPDGFRVEAGWTWDSVNGFAMPAQDGTGLEPLDVASVSLVAPTRAPLTVNTDVAAVASAAPVATTSTILTAQASS